MRSTSGREYSHVSNQVPSSRVPFAPKYSPPTSSRTINMSMPFERRGTEIGVDAELLADAEETLLGAHGPALELGQTDRGEQHGVALPARRERLVRQRRPLGEDRVPAEGVLGVLDPERIEHADRLGGDLGPDPVAGKDGDVGHAIPCAVSYAAISSSCCMVRAMSSRPCRRR